MADGVDHGGGGAAGGNTGGLIAAGARSTARPGSSVVAWKGIEQAEPVDHGVVDPHDHRLATALQTVDQRHRPRGSVRGSTAVARSPYSSSSWRASPETGRVRSSRCSRRSKSASSTQKGRAPKPGSADLLGGPRHQAEAGTDGQRDVVEGDPAAAAAQVEDRSSGCAAACPGPPCATGHGVDLPIHSMVRRPRRIVDGRRGAEVWREHQLGQRLRGAAGDDQGRGRGRGRRGCRSRSGRGS